MRWNAKVGLGAALPKVASFTQNRLLVHKLALGMSAPELTAVVEAWQNGAISRETMRHLFGRSEILPEGRTNEEEARLVAVGNNVEPDGGYQGIHYP